MRGGGAGVGNGWWVAGLARWARWVGRANLVGWCARGVVVGRVGGWVVVGCSRAAPLSKYQWEVWQTQHLSPAKVLRFVRGALTLRASHGVAVPLGFAAVGVWRVRTKTKTKVGRTTVNHVATALPAGRTMRSEAIRVFQKLEQSPRLRRRSGGCSSCSLHSHVPGRRKTFVGASQSHLCAISGDLTVLARAAR